MISRRTFVGALAGTAISSTLLRSVDTQAGILRYGNIIDLYSPYFVFRLDVADGLRAVLWHNKITNKTLPLGNGSELEFDIGLPGTSRSEDGMSGDSLQTPRMRVVRSPAKSTVGVKGKAVFKLAFKLQQASTAIAWVTYTWDTQVPVLHKQVRIRNVSGEPWDRLLNIRLGSYRHEPDEIGDPDYPVSITQTPWGSTTWIQWADPAGRTRGFPAYMDWQFFLGLAHPSGFALQNRSHLTLQQHPGCKLAPGASFDCMEAVYGVSPAGEARKAFRTYLQSKMRRVRRKHDRPYAILSSFGGNPTGDIWENAAYLEDNLSKVAQGQRDSSLHWDLYSIDFWHDPFGDLITPDKKRFPKGFDPLLEKLAQLNTRPGLWIDSGGFTAPPVVGFPIWTCGRNPALKNATTLSDNHGGLCRATYPANTFYIDGFIHQCKNNGVRMLAFDNCGWPECFLDPTCNNPRHKHLPGPYSTEAIQNAIIEFFQRLDAACPDVFIKLFWGYRSPWWLLHVDTLFDLGLRIEAATPAEFPTLVLRDSVTRVLDRARWMAKDVPWLGADSLGVWLADWPWDMFQGEAKWQDGVVMDICRGQMLPQLWTDAQYLYPAGREQMAVFIALVKACPDCFSNSRFIIGNPWKNEPYGYACTDGKRAFVAINNGVWHDSTIPLEFNARWGLPEHGKWDIYRWYPEPALLKAGTGKPTLGMGPFETILLEIVPKGSAPSLRRKWRQTKMPQAPARRSFQIQLDVISSRGDKTTPIGSNHEYWIGVKLPAGTRNQCLAITAEFFKDGQPFLTLWNPDILVANGNSNGQILHFQSTINPTIGTWYPSCWQTWRLDILENSTLSSLEVHVKSSLPSGVDIRWSGYLMPSGPT